MSSKKFAYSEEFKLKVLQHYFKHGGDSKFGLKSKTALHFGIDKKTITRMLCNDDMVQKASKLLLQKDMAYISDTKASSSKSSKSKISNTSVKSCSVPEKTFSNSETSKASQKNISVIELPEDPDYSLLKKSINSSASGAANIARLLVTATNEVQKLLLNECDLIFECKVCKNLFRSVVNFLAHKRVYCEEEFVNVKTSFSAENPHGVSAESGTIIVNPESAPPSPISESNCQVDRIAQALANKKRKFDELSSSTDTGSSEYFQRIQNIHNIRSDITKNVSVVIKDIGDSPAVYQTFVPPGETVSKKGIHDLLLKVHQKDSAGKTLVVKPDFKAVNSTSSESIKVDQQDDVSQASSDVGSGPSEAGLDTGQPEERTIYTCPICDITFLSVSGCVKHLYKVHKKKKHQRDRLRHVIRSRSYKRLLTPEEIKASHNRTPDAPKFENPKRDKKPSEDKPKLPSKSVDISLQCREGPRKRASERWKCNVCGKKFLSRPASLAHIATHIVCDFEPKAIQIFEPAEEDLMKMKSISKSTKLDNEYAKIIEEGFACKEKISDSQMISSQNVDTDKKTDWKLEEKIGNPLTIKLKKCPLLKAPHCVEEGKCSKEDVAILKENVFPDNAKTVSKSIDICNSVSYGNSQLKFDEKMCSNSNRKDDLNKERAEYVCNIQVSNSPKSNDSEVVSSQSTTYTLINNIENGGPISSKEIKLHGKLMKEDLCCYLREVKYQLLFGNGSVSSKTIKEETAICKVAVASESIKQESDTTETDDDASKQFDIKEEIKTEDNTSELELKLEFKEELEADLNNSSNILIKSPIVCDSICDNDPPLSKFEIFTSVPNDSKVLLEKCPMIASCNLPEKSIQSQADFSKKETFDTVYQDEKKDNLLYSKVIQISKDKQFDSTVISDSKSVLDVDNKGSSHSLSLHSHVVETPAHEMGFPAISNPGTASVVLMADNQNKEKSLDGNVKSISFRSNVTNSLEVRPISVALPSLRSTNLIFPRLKGKFNEKIPRTMLKNSDSDSLEKRDESVPKSTTAALKENVKLFTINKLGKSVSVLMQPNLINSETVQKKSLPYLIGLNKYKKETNLKDIRVHFETREKYTFKKDALLHKTFSKDLPSEIPNSDVQLKSIKSIQKMEPESASNKGINEKLMEMNSNITQTQSSSKSFESKNYRELLNYSKSLTQKYFPKSSLGSNYLKSTYKVLKRKSSEESLPASKAPKTSTSSDIEPGCSRNQSSITFDTLRDIPSTSKGLLPSLEKTSLEISLNVDKESASLDEKVNDREDQIPSLENKGSIDNGAKNVTINEEEFMNQEMGFGDVRYDCNL